MNIVISTFGVRGDVQPYLALAVGLQGAGHRVTLATSDSFTGWIEGYGAATYPTRFNMQAELQTPEAQDATWEAIQVAVTAASLRGRVGREDPC